MSLGVIVHAGTRDLHKSVHVSCSVWKAMGTKNKYRTKSRILLASEHISFTLVMLMMVVMFALEPLVCRRILLLLFIYLSPLGKKVLFL